MALRLTSVKSLLKACTAVSKTTPTLKNMFAVNQGFSRPALCYTQSRGIFWGDKKPKDGETASAEAEQKTENTQKPEENVKQEATNKTEKKPETKKEETTQKAQTNNKNQEANKQQNNGEDEAFDVLLEDPTNENKKKIHKLWLKMEREVEEKNKQLNNLKKEMDVLDKTTGSLQQKIDDLRARLKEEIEERELMRKRFDKELDQSKIYAITKFAKDLIDVPDNLSRALEAAKDLEGKGDNLYDGVKATYAILLKTLGKHGVNQLNPLGEKFDPNFHEALFDFQDPKQKPGTCGYVATVGYTINDRVLRPAKVGIVKGTEKIEDHHADGEKKA